MNVEQILVELEARKIRVRIEGEGLALEGPRGALPPELAEEIRRRKPELVKALALFGWPEASQKAAREHGVPHARLYPYLDRTVLTPLGRGRLVEVLPNRAGVHLAGRVFVFLPSEVRPPGVTCQNEEHFEAVH